MFGNTITIRQIGKLLTTYFFNIFIDIEKKLKRLFPLVLNQSLDMPITLSISQIIPPSSLSKFLIIFPPLIYYSICPQKLSCFIQFTLLIWPPHWVFRELKSYLESLQKLTFYLQSNYTSSYQVIFLFFYIFQEPAIEQIENMLNIIQTLSF